MNTALSFSGGAALSTLLLEPTSKSSPSLVPCFPDNHTRIPWRGKPAEECPDSHRYKAIGNNMAVPVMRWIGNRIKDYINTGRKAV